MLGGEIMNVRVLEESLIIKVVKCFFILLFFGEIFPFALDIFFYYFVDKVAVYDNSVLVYNIINRNIDILYNYIYIFQEFLRY